MLTLKLLAQYSVSKGLGVNQPQQLSWESVRLKILRSVVQSRVAAFFFFFKLIVCSKDDLMILLEQITAFQNEKFQGQQEDVPDDVKFKLKAWNQI